MLPHQGQGANQTIEDAITLAGCLAEAEPDRPEAALRRYEVLRRARTRNVQTASRRACECMHVADGTAAEVRNRDLGDLPDDIAWIHAHDAREQPFAVC
jgi:salicylate hydroxylase